MPIVEIPNVGEVEFPDDMPPAKIKAEARRLSGQATQGNQNNQEFETGEVIGRQGLSRFVDNILGLPDLAVTLGGQAAGQLLPKDFNPRQLVAQPLRAPIDMGAEAIRQVTGGGVDPAASSERVRQNLPDVGQRVLNGPRSEDVFAGAQMLGEGAAAITSGTPNQNLSTFSEAQEQQRQITEQQREQNPVASTVGTGLGDAATLVTGRSPIATAARNRRVAAQHAQNAMRPTEKLAPGTQKLINDILTSGPVKKLARGAGRSVETGIEGAVISSLNEGDPLETAAYAAGGQMAGSLALTAFPPTSKGLINFAATTGGLAALARMGQEFGPGQNNIFEAIDVAFDKTKFALVTGALSALAGAGRIRSGALADNLPNVAEAITQIPRGMALSVLNDVTKENEQGVNKTLPVLGRMSTDPEFFGKDARRRIERAMKSEKMSVSQEIDKLMKNREFKNKFLKLGNTQSNQQQPEPAGR